VAAPVSQTALGASVITDKDLALLIGGCLAGHVAAGRVVRRKYRWVVLGIALAGYFLASAAVGAGAAAVCVRCCCSRCRCCACR
jgi:hypothetical protein